MMILTTLTDTTKAGAKCWKFEKREKDMNKAKRDRADSLPRYGGVPRTFFRYSAKFSADNYIFFIILNVSTLTST